MKVLNDMRDEYIGAEIAGIVADNATTHRKINDLDLEDFMETAGS